MKYISARTTVADPYRAGVQLGEQLEVGAPEVAVVFCTIQYVNAAGDLLAGIRDVLGEKVLVCGGSSDGIYETRGMATHGVCALGINPEGTSQWKAVMVRGVGKDSAGAAAEASRQVHGLLGEPATLGFALADGLKADGSRLVEGLRASMHAPCFGGLAADDRSLKRSVTFLNDDVTEDGLLLLAASGRVPARMNAASGWKPIGDFGRVTRATGATIHEIDGLPAERFLREQTGKTVGGMEFTVLPLAAYAAEGDERFVLRSCSRIDPGGSITLFGRVAEGVQVRVCHASIDEILGGVADALRGIADDQFDPGAALVISCAGRRWLLAEAGQEEVDRTNQQLGSLPFVGIPSYGEICPFRSPEGNYSSAMFHNVTFVVCVLGR